MRISNIDKYVDTDYKLIRNPLLNHSLDLENAIRFTSYHFVQTMTKIISNLYKQSKLSKYRSSSNNQIMFR